MHTHIYMYDFCFSNCSLCWGECYFEWIEVAKHTKKYIFIIYMYINDIEKHIKTCVPLNLKYEFMVRVDSNP